MFSGEIVETEEMRPRWFDIGAIPYDQMWPDDERWYPLMLENKTFKAYYLFQGQDKILHEKLTVDDC